MNHRGFLLACVVVVCSALVCSGANPPSRSEVQAALNKATEYLTSISTEGGYLWRYSKDLKDRRGEEIATPTQIWVQPPGTPSVGMAFLEAYAATKDQRQLAAAAAAALALVRGQLQSGGWAYLVDFDPAARRAWAYRADLPAGETDWARRKNITTFDDNNTQSALQFLLAFLDVATNRSLAEVKSVRSAVDYGLSKMLEAQYPNGAWPQRFNGRPHDPERHPVRPARLSAVWPHTWPKSDYGAFYTLNDHTQRDCIRTMLQAHQRFNDPKYLNAARKGGEFLVLAQLPEPQPGWAQQYNFDMEPAWARAFEPPAVCSSESVGAMRTLAELYLETGEGKFLQPIPAFVAWLKRSEIGPNRWARFYELGTNRPLYGDRDGQLHYTLEELSAERQHGYAWQGNFGIPGAIAYCEAIRAEGRDGFLARQKKDRRPSPAPGDVARLLAAQDSQGRWLTNDWIDMRRFIANIQVLADSLRADGAVPTSQH